MAMFKVRQAFAGFNTGDVIERDPADNDVRGWLDMGKIGPIVQEQPEIFEVAPEPGQAVEPLEDEPKKRGRPRKKTG